MLGSLFYKISFALPIYKYQITGESMAPTFKNGEIVFANRFAYLFQKPKLGEIIAIKDPRDGKVLIKRIKKIDNKKIFVIGDNKVHSTDSREFGMIEQKDIIGKVIYP